MTLQKFYGTIPDTKGKGALVHLEVAGFGLNGQLMVSLAGLALFLVAPVAPAWDYNR